MIKRAKRPLAYFYMSLPLPSTGLLSFPISTHFPLSLSFCWFFTLSLSSCDCVLFPQQQLFSSSLLSILGIFIFVCIHLSLLMSILMNHSSQLNWNATSPMKSFLNTPNCLFPICLHIILYKLSLQLESQWLVCSHLEAA